MNRFQFLGRLTKEVEVRYGQDANTVVAILDVAVNRRYANSSGEREADFFKVTAFGKTAEFCKNYFTKGMQVLVEGRIQNRTWEDQTGAKRYATDYIAEQVYIADGKRETAQTTQQFTQEDYEELPF